MRELRKAITRIDLLVLLGALSFVIQAAIPGIDVAREAARRSHCSYNLREISQGVLNHVDLNNKVFPSGGWGHHWIGEPERGTGIDQPGGWIFNTLAYVDQEELRNAGLGLQGREREKAIIERCRTEVGLFICPSRHSVALYNNGGKETLITKDGKIRPFGGKVAKSDYAACSGNLEKINSFVKFKWTFPKSLEEGDAEDFQWPADLGYLGYRGETLRPNGIIYGRSATKLEDIVDGTSNTYLIGEKTVRKGFYTNGKDAGDTRSMYVGFCSDTSRVTSHRATPDQKLQWANPNRFGGPHPEIWLVAFADGSVREMSYAIDDSVHKASGDINAEATAEAASRPKVEFKKKKEVQAEGTSEGVQEPKATIEI